LGCKQSHPDSKFFEYKCGEYYSYWILNIKL
jgi:hypothetical protein